MQVACLDLEGVLVPEIWIAFSEKTGIEELRLTTREVPDYDALMRRRIGILEKRGLTLGDIQDVIGSMDPLPGAGDFLESLRSRVQVIILSDTFTQFAQPLMRKLRWPTLFCNTLETDERNMITGFRLRQREGKKHAVIALKSINMRVAVAGDSYNDILMIQEADSGTLFRAPESIKGQFPAIPTAETYQELEARLMEGLFP
jgi:phosphoserine/homoserine phosphotransferase